MNFETLCKKADWLQKLWKPKEGDKFLVHATGHVYFSVGHVANAFVQCITQSWCGSVKQWFNVNDVSWLPNSDDLFELLPVNYEVNRMYISVDKMRCFARKPTIPVWQTETFFGSTAKEALLQAVAFELYNFTWEGDIEEWVNLSIEPLVENKVKDGKMRKALCNCPEPDLQRFYYYRDVEDRSPRVTVCIAKFGNIVTRGVTICSFSEKQISKANGRARAAKRAKLAYAQQRTSLPVLRDEATSVIRCCGFIPSPHFDFKSYLNPPLTPFELELLHGDSGIV